MEQGAEPKFEHLVNDDEHELVGVDGLGGQDALGGLPDRGPIRFDALLKVEQHVEGKVLGESRTLPASPSEEILKQMAVQDGPAPEPHQVVPPVPKVGSIHAVG